MSFMGLNEILVQVVLDLGRVEGRKVVANFFGGKFEDSFPLNF